MKRSASRLTLLFNTAIGIAAFCVPFVVTMHGSPNSARSSDAPYWGLAVATAALVSILNDLRSERVSSTQIAMLGICSGVLAMLRLFDLPSGANSMFFFVVILGAGFGSRFGYYVGLLGMLCSAFFTGGIGPWLPFQALALGWMGAGAGVVAQLIGTRRLGLLSITLAGYAFVWGFIYGGLLNLWFWPLYSTSGPLSFHPGASIVSNLGHYWSFYGATSLIWDAAAAFTNAILVAVTVRPLLRSFSRVSHRMTPSISWGAPA